MATVNGTFVTNGGSTGTTALGASQVIIYASQYSTLQDAVSALPSGGTIIVDVDLDVTNYAPVNINSYISLVGDHPQRTITNTANGPQHIVGVDVQNVEFKCLNFVGPGANSTNPNGGGGIWLHNKNQANIMNVYMEEVTVKGCVNDAIAIAVPIASTFNNVRVTNIVGNGFAFYNGGTSITMNSCYASSCTESGFALININYSTLNSCAVDGSGYGFYLSNCKSINVNACGSEMNQAWKSPYNGDGFRVNGGSDNTFISCYSRDDQRWAIYFGFDNSETYQGTHSLTQFQQWNSNNPPWGSGSIYVDSSVKRVNIFDYNVMLTPIFSGTTNIVVSGTVGQS